MRLLYLELWLLELIDELARRFEVRLRTRLRPRCRSLEVPSEFGSRSPICASQRVSAAFVIGSYAVRRQVIGSFRLR